MGFSFHCTKVTLSLFSRVDWGSQPLGSTLSSGLLAAIGLSLLVRGRNTSKTIHSSLFSSLSYWVSHSFTSSLSQGSGVISRSLFLALLLLNAAGLPPYILPLTSYPTWVILSSLSLWRAITLSSYCHNFASAISHYTPLGRPSLLSPLLSSVELVSSVIRPLTLTLRLTINISTGHLLLSLSSLSLCSCLMTAWTLIPALLLITIAIYCLFELGVAFIQSLVFVMLVNQYSLEHP